MEIWKKIPNFNNYSCSINGDIRNNSTSRFFKLNPNQNEYVRINIKNKEKIKKCVQVHRLIALTWIPNPYNKSTVNHKNKIRNDNRVINLEWMTYKEQSIHKLNNVIKKNINNNRGVWQCDKVSGKKIKYFRTNYDASLYINNNKKGASNISLCAKNKIKIAYGFKWKYTDICDKDNEIWKIFHKCGKNIYYVSNYGRIKNKNRMIKPSLHRSGYYYFSMNGKTTGVHRIVAQMFIPNLQKLFIVNHMDGNKVNNHHKNLEWCTTKYNIIDAINNGLRNNVKKVIRYDKNGVIWGVYNSCSDAGRKTNVCIRSINKCCKGMLNSCGKNNYMFKYLSPTDDIENMKIDCNTICKKKYKKVYKKRQIKKVVVYDSKNVLLEICKNKTEASKKYNVNIKTVTNHCNNKIKYSSLKYAFSYYID